MKICLIITQLEFGGAQKAMSVLAQGLSSHGHDVHLYCFYDKGNFVSEFEKKYDVKYKVLIDKYTGNIFFKSFKTIRSFFALFKIIRSEKFDIVQTFTHYSNILVPVISKLANKKTKVITSQRASILPLGRTLVKFDNLIQNSTFVDKMTCVSKSIRESCINDERIKYNKLHVIPNGISLPKADISKSEMREKLSIDQNSIVFITVARFHEQKGHAYLVGAIKNIIDSGFNNFIFMFVGGGHLSEKIRLQCIELQLGDSVMFLGERNDIPDLLNMSDAFILPSLWEGMPNSVLEAMASATCVIATEVDGTKELIDNEVHGILIPPASEIHLVNSIIDIGNNKEKRNKLAQNGRSRVFAEYTNEATIDKYIDLYMREIGN